MTKYIFLLSSLLFSFQLVAQQEVGLHFMENVWQQTRTNPALLTEHKLTIGTGSIYNNLSFTGPTYGQLFQERDGNTIIDINSVIGQMNERNEIREHLEVQTLEVAFGLKKLRFGLSHTMKYDAYLNYPKTLPQVIWEGNAQFIDQTIDLSHNMNFTAYNEFALSAAFQVAKLSVGVKGKYLSGIGTIENERGNINLYTDPDIYQLTLSTDYQLNTSGFLNYNSITDFQTDIQSTQFSIGQNNGFAFDAGVALDLEKLQIAASIIDLGSISWEENSTNLSANGTITYEGLDISQALTGDGASFEGALDTLAQIFDFQETNETFSTQLPTKMYLSARFRATDMVTIGGLYFSEFYRNEVFTGFAASGQFQLKDWLSLGATYSVLNRTYDNLGLNAAFKFGPVQLYATTDNVIGLINAQNSRRLSGRVGLNFVFL